MIFDLKMNGGQMIIMGGVSADTIKLYLRLRLDEHIKARRGRRDGYNAWMNEMEREDWIVQCIMKEASEIKQWRPDEFLYYYNSITMKPIEE